MEKDNIVASQPIEAAEKIKFRFKFASKIPEGMEETFIRSVNAFNAMSEHDALYVLWDLTCEPEKGLKPLDLTSNADDNTLPFKGPDFIPEELIFPFRNELRYQRTLVDNSFPHYSVPASCQEAFNKLKNATAQDIITTVMVLLACQNKVAFYDTDSIERTQALLNNKHENICFGGLRSLQFTYEEAVYLKPFVHQIAELLSALWEENKKEMPEPEMNFVQKEEQMVTTKIPDEKNETISNDKPLSMNAVMVNIEVFENFYNACQKIRENGFSLNEAVAKLDSISKILEAYKVLG